MYVQNTISIHGDPGRVCRRVFELASNLQDWPRLLSHYWYMRVLEDSGRHKVADFGAYRDFGWRFPCRWRARQELFPEAGRITFEHIGGVTRGMRVEWRIVPCPDGAEVTIAHWLDYPIPLLGPWFAHYVVGKLFVHHIAGQTLRRFQAIVEAEERATKVHGARADDNTSHG